MPVKKITFDFTEQDFKILKMAQRKIRRNSEVENFRAINFMHTRKIQQQINLRHEKGRKTALRVLTA